MSEEDFAADYMDKYCEELTTCGSEFECADTTGTATGTTTSEITCEFDSAAAKDCLDGEWTCDDTLKLPVPPSECGSVYTNCTGTPTGTGT